MDEHENAADQELAASFGDLLAHKEAIQILHQYRRGFEICMIRGWGTSAEEPTYRVLIYKLLPGITDEDKKKYYEWEAEGMGQSYHGALLQANARAQKYLQNPPTP